MKALAIIAAIVFSLSLASCASAQDAPQKVKDAFLKKFPTAKSVKWEKENDTEWEAEFKMDGMEYSSNFTQDGTWQETEHEIKMADVPQNVHNTLRNSYSDFKIKESEISETSAGMAYEFELKNGSKKMEVAINSEGNVVKKEMDENGDSEMDETDED